MSSGDIGLIGLAVMGQNLALNIADHGFNVVVFNRTVSKVDDFLAGEAHGHRHVSGVHDLSQLVAALKRPRKVLLMVKAGAAVDDFIDQLTPLLAEGDIIIDGGNSLFSDTVRRCRSLKDKGIAYVGCGISGGEEGARHGPSLMPGGNEAAWPALKPIFQAIAAKASDGVPCCDWVGDEGAGHYVKMVHNGIEYGDMQLISEAYQLLRQGLNLPLDRLADIFNSWNAGKLDSYLIEITAQILAFRDEDEQPLLDKILDVAGQKGTGRWTVIDALEQGVPLTLIAEAVFARCLSALKDERRAAAHTLTYAPPGGALDERWIEQVRQGLYAAKIVSYAQGFMLMRQAAAAYRWRLNYGAIAMLWRGGCIIRSAFLNNIKEAYDRDAELSNLLLDPYFAAELSASQQGWRRVVSEAALRGIAAPCMAAALSFFDGYRSAVLPANLLQAQRDYFGAHTYERVDRPRGQYFHTNWTGSGGAVSAGSYSA